MQAKSKAIVPKALEEKVAPRKFFHKRHEVSLLPNLIEIEYLEALLRGSFIQSS